MPVRCVEPGLVNDTDKSIVNVPSGTELLFPHVDSCLAIAMVLTDGRMIGGHVSMQEATQHAPIDPWGNAMAMIFNMQPLCGGTAISKLILVGDELNWSTAMGELILNLGCANSLCVKTGSFGGGVDVLLDADKVAVSGCTTAKRYTLAYDYLQGKMSKPL